MALWNSNYFREWQSSSPRPTSRARGQIVSVLNVRSDRIYDSKVEGVHFHKGFGTAEISRASILAWCQQWHPDKVPELVEHLRIDSDPLFLDFEPTLHGLEQLHGYRAIMDAARNERLLSAAHKGFLACGLMMHAMRSYEFCTKVLQDQHGGNDSKWRYLWLLKTAWASELILARFALPLVMGQWTLWRTADPTFPLCDSPVVIRRDGVLAVLSPRLLLEIDLTVAGAEDHCILRNTVPTAELDVFRAAVLRNTFKELVAWDRSTLEEWRGDQLCQNRVEALTNNKTRDAVMVEAAARVVWGLMGFGRVPDDFEEWAPAISDKALSEKGRALLSELRSKSDGITP